MRRSFWRFAAVLASAALGLGLSGPALAGAVPRTVCPSGCAYPSIRAALTAASPGDTIELQPGTYSEHLTISTNVTIDGQGATIDGGGTPNNGSVLIVERGVSVTLRGLTIANGWSPDFGGGILNYGRLTLEDAQVVDNVAAAGGGGIYNNGVLTLQDSQVTDNAAGESDGGILNDTGSVNIAGSLVADNAPSNCGSTPLGSACQD